MHGLMPSCWLRRSSPGLHRLTGALIRLDAFRNQGRTVLPVTGISTAPSQEWTLNRPPKTPLPPRSPPVPVGDFELVLPAAVAARSAFPCSWLPPQVARLARGGCP